MSHEAQQRSFERESRHIRLVDIPLIGALFASLGFDEQVEVTDDRGMIRMSREKYNEKYGGGTGGGGNSQD